MKNNRKLKTFESDKAKDTIETMKKDLNNSYEKIITLKLAIKGLLGDISEYIVDKLVEIGGEISAEQNRITLLESIIKDSQSSQTC